MQSEEGSDGPGPLLWGPGAFLPQLSQHGTLHSPQVAAEELQVTQVSQSGGAGLQEGQDAITQLATQVLQCDRVQCVRRQGRQFQSQKPLLQTRMLEDGAQCSHKNLKHRNSHIMHKIT